MATRKKIRKHHLDRLDAEAIRDMLGSRGWKLFAARLARFRAVKLEELERPADEVKTALTRGALEAIRAIAAIPDILIREGSKANEGSD